MYLSQRPSHRISWAKPLNSTCKKACSMRVSTTKGVLKNIKAKQTHPTEDYWLVAYGTALVAVSKARCLWPTFSSRTRFYHFRRTTNHLDLGDDWVGLKAISTAAIKPCSWSHDRFFLDRSMQCHSWTRQSLLDTYRGNYSYYLEREARTHDNAEGWNCTRKQSLSRRIGLMRRMPRARGHSTISRRCLLWFRSKGQQRIEERQLRLNNVYIAP